MISVLLNWIYMGITTFSLGFGIRKLIEKLLGYSLQNVDSIIMAGVISTTVYAQVFSLFGPVGLWANVGMVLAAALVCVCYGREMLQKLLGAWKQQGNVYRVVLILLVAFWAYQTSRGYMMLDTDLYHAQSIRWLEEYGVVPGLGNLHERFAYNSSFFSFSALYSMKFLFGQSLHTGNGFFALLLSVLCIQIGKRFHRRKLVWSDFARVAGIYYLTIIADEVIAPTSDYCIMCMIFYIVIKWLDELEKGKGDVVPFGLLCVAGVYALTLKLTAGLILVLVIKPAYQLIREKKWKEIGIFLCSGILVCAPWMIRTVIISGYLLYPFPQLDLFSLDWKMAAQRVEIDAANIKVWGRGLYDITLLDLPITAWFQQWMQSLTTMEKLLILADLLCLAVLSVWMLTCLLKRHWEKLDAMLVMVTVAACYVFWQLSAPLVRYGYAYILLLAALMGGYFVTLLRKDGMIRLAILAYGCYKLFIMGSLVWSSRQLDYYVCQQDYGVYEVREVSLGTESVFVPLNGGLSGYAYFPSVPALYNVELRGESFAEGFRPCE